MQTGKNVDVTMAKKLNNKENQMSKELWLAEQLFSEFSTLFHNFPATRIFPLSNQMNQHPDTHLFVGQNENFQGHQIITEQEFFSGKTFSFAIFVCFVYEICVYRKKHGKNELFTSAITQSTVHNWPSVFARVRQAVAILPFSACKQRTCLQ